MKRGPLAWVHRCENRFEIVESRDGGFFVNPTFGMGRACSMSGEFFNTRSQSVYWRNKFGDIFKAGFIEGMNYITNIPDKNQTDLFKTAE